MLLEINVSPSTTWKVMFSFYLYFSNMHPCTSTSTIQNKKEGHYTARHKLNYSGAVKFNFLQLFQLDISKHRFLKLDEQN